MIKKVLVSYKLNFHFFTVDLNTYYQSNNLFHLIKTTKREQKFVNKWYEVSKLFSVNIHKANYITFSLHLLIFPILFLLN